MMRIWDRMMETSLLTDFFNLCTSDFFNFFTFISIVDIAGQTIFVLFQVFSKVIDPSYFYLSCRTLLWGMEEERYSFPRILLVI